MASDRQPQGDCIRLLGGLSDPASDTRIWGNGTFRWEATMYWLSKAAASGHRACATEHSQAFLGLTFWPLWQTLRQSWNLPEVRLRGGPGGPKGRALGLSLGLAKGSLILEMQSLGSPPPTPAGNPPNHPTYIKFCPSPKKSSMCQSHVNSSRTPLLQIQDKGHDIM